MFGYATDLRSNTQGRANYTMQFEGYEEVPPNIAEKIVEAAHRGAGPGLGRSPGGAAAEAQQHSIKTTAFR